jgi:predicted transcriptional regulator
MNVHPEDFVSMTRCKRDTLAHLRRLRKTRRPGVLTINGTAAAGVMDAAAYARWIASIDRAEAIAGIRRGLQESAAGRVSTVDDAFARFRSGRRARRSA